MKLIMYIDCEAGPAGRHLRKTILERFPKIQQEHHGEFESFHRRLCSPIHAQEQLICIVLADSPERLDRLIKYKELLEDRRLVLILTDNQKDMLSKGHQLLPRYVGNINDDEGDLVSVLEKMIVSMNRICGKARSD